jgi:hypothetical protein
LCFDVTAVLGRQPITPLLAPNPIAWLCPGFRIDDNFAREIKAYSNLEITFGSQTLLASTFDGKEREAVMSILRVDKLAPRQIVDLNFGGEHFISYSFPLSTETGTVVALLQRSLDKELAPYLRLERTYLILALVGLLISAALGTWIARGVSNLCCGLLKARARSARVITPIGSG